MPVRLHCLIKDKKPELICGSLCLFVLVAVSIILLRRTLYIDSANANLEAYAIPLSSEVEGEVLEVYVREHQSVKKGQILCGLEDRRYRSRLADAEAKREAVRARFEVSRRDLGRASQLLARGHLAPSTVDRVRSDVGDLDGKLKAADSAVADARVNLSRTRVLAPADGVIAFRTARPGLLAQTGAPLFGFVDSRARWVVARVRETDLADLHIGKPVQVSFDSVPGREFRGRIASLSPSTESEFYGALPADFSAGNYTKYVQWHPIRIELAARDLVGKDGSPIPIGVSSTVHMKRD